MPWFARGQLIFLLVAYLYLGTVQIPQAVGASLNDLFLHAFGYAILMASGMFTFPRRQVLLALFLTFLAYSFMIECIQYFLPYRSFSWSDMVANGAGLAIGFGLGLIFLPLMKKIRVDLTH